MSSNIALREHLYKVLHRWYWTPCRISKMFPNASMACWRCGDTMATFSHIWWDRCKINVYWETVSRDVEMIIGQRIPFTLKTYLLHDYSDLKLSGPRKMLLLAASADGSQQRK